MSKLDEDDDLMSMDLSKFGDTDFDMISEAEQIKAKKLGGRRL